MTKSFHFFGMGLEDVNFLHNHIPDVHHLQLQDSSMRSFESTTAISDTGVYPKAINARLLFQEAQCIVLYFVSHKW